MAQLLKEQKKLCTNVSSTAQQYNFKEEFNEFKDIAKKQGKTLYFALKEAFGFKDEFDEFKDVAKKRGKTLNFAIKLALVNYIKKYKHIVG